MSSAKLYLEEQKVSVAVGSSKDLQTACNEISKDLSAAKASFEIWCWVADNAVAVNQSCGKVALATFQIWALNEAILSIARMFDERKDVYSIKYAIGLLSNTTLKKRVAFEAYLKAIGADKSFEHLSDADLVSRGLKFINELKTDLDRKELAAIRSRRHENIAHSARTKSEDLLFEQHFQACIKWIEDFLGMTRTCFGAYEVVGSIQSAKQSLINLCRMAGIVPDPYANLDRKVR